MSAYQTNKLRTHFLVYSVNPLKVIVAIVTVIHRLIVRFPSLEIAKNYLMPVYTKFGRTIIINYQDINQVDMMLHDKMYNGKLVIDQIAEYDVYDLFMSRKPLVICNENWSGRFESESFMNYSLNFRIVNAILFKKKNFVGYSTNFVHELKRMVKLYPPIEQGKKKPHKSHIFMFKSWKKSMALRYLIDAIFIVVVSTFMQLKMNEFQKTGQQYYSIFGEYMTSKVKAHDTSLSTSDLIAAKAEFADVEDRYLEISNRAYDQLTEIYYFWMVLTAYLIRNICQIIYAKLRNKNWTVILDEFILSILQFILIFIGLYRHYVIYMHANPEDPRYYKHDVIVPAYSEKILNMTLILGLYMGIQWARVVFLFKTNYILGPMINILFKMLKTILKFLIIYGMITLVYMSSGRIMFVSIPEFENETNAIVTLISASLGSFSFDIFDSPNLQVQARYCYFYLITYLAISNVILLNFIIAILSTIYDEVKGFSRLIYL